MDRANLRHILRGRNVFVQGVGFVGTVGDVEPPVVKFKQAEDGNLGRNIDSGLLEPMECKLTIFDLNPVIFEAVGKRLGELASFVIKSSIVSGSKEIPVYFEVGAHVTEQEWENLKETGKETGINLTLNVVQYKLEIDGKEHYDIDADRYICKIDGKDHFENLRKQIM
ncbi:phage major tail tube protein [Nitratifractor salsuginis]|uniref:Major tail tube protein n=1 Tax=Nitratifractor salsuginis (strain DSM 16511 / JCM 12458 / E9I37-1) TaxID=749222 RepID=E6X1M7_NITSE|nr:phage major tail tube protein [Nitratifractor salsuginis]ADV47018.1 major tail tube protein [Nitratifractor salsuginis DSM 16511]